jgi:hypothetical protein
MLRLKIDLAMRGTIHAYRSAKAATGLRNGDGFYALLAASKLCL